MFLNKMQSLRQTNITSLHNTFCRFKHGTHVKVLEDDGVRNIILNDLKTRNSLSLDMMRAIRDAINSDVNSEALRAIVLSAEGPVFSAGHNLKQLTSESGISNHQEVFKTCTSLMMSIIRSPVPVIAKVNGLAAAAGCQLVSTCDIIIATDISKFSTPGASFGIFCSTPGIAIARSMPKSAALYMLLTGDTITAQEAYTYGLITKSVPEACLDKEMEKILKSIKSKSKCVIALGKSFFYEQIKLNVEDAYALGENVMVENINLPDGQEGISSFIDKRKPQWKHSS